MLIVIVWIFVAGLARLMEGTWWSPGSIMALVLATNALGTTIFAPEYYMSISANFYLQALVFVVSVGTALGQRFTKRVSPASAEIFKIRRKTAFFSMGMFAAILSAFYTLQTTGIPVSDLSSPLAVMRAAQRVTQQRYSEGLDFPVLYNLSNALLLSYAIAFAVHMAAIRRFEWWLSIPLMIFVITNMLITARGPILFMLLLMAFAAVFANKHTSPTGRFVSLRDGTVLKFAVALVGFVGAVFVMFQILRFGEGNTRSVAEVATYLRRWPWGSLPGFSLWFDGLAGQSPDTIPGYYTFMGIYDNLGIAGRQQGAYTDYVYLTRGEPANIYTAFRGFYHDFGIVGSGVFLFLVGVVGGKVCKGYLFGPYASLSIYVGVMTFTAYAFVISFWAYTANLAALIILPLVLKYYTSESKTSSSVEAGTRNNV